jgi:hypothetical protein
MFGLFPDFELVLLEPCGSILCTLAGHHAEHKLTPTMYVIVGRFVISFYMYMDDCKSQCLRQPDST